MRWRAATRSKSLLRSAVVTLTSVVVVAVSVNGGGVLERLVQLEIPYTLSPRRTMVISHRGNQTGSNFTGKMVDLPDRASVDGGP